MALPSNLKDIFQTNFDDLLIGLGKPVVLYFEEIITNEGDGGFDNIHNTSRKPQHKTDPPTISVTTLTINALQKWNPRNLEDYGIHLEKPTTVLRLKTNLTDLPNLRRASYIVPSSESADYIRAKFKMITEPVPFGIQEDHYATTFWERV